MAELDRVRTWAKALIALHLDASWNFEFDHAKTRAGLCNYSAKRISVSRHLAAKYADDEIHQVLLHEVAHAIAMARDGKSWQRSWGTRASDCTTVRLLWSWRHGSDRVAVVTPTIVIAPRLVSSPVASAPRSSIRLT